jgi:hypothetical protein
MITGERGARFVLPAIVMKEVCVTCGSGRLNSTCGESVHCHNRLGEEWARNAS